MKVKKISKNRPIVGGKLLNFYRRISIKSDCWEWTGYVSPLGYGQYNVDGKSVFAHRYAYEICVGDIPDNLVIDHLCRNTRCVRPDHLEAVTQRENVLRGVGIATSYSKRTHCKHGHALTSDNLMRVRRGARTCRTCHNERSRIASAKWRARKRVAMGKTNMI